MKNFITAILTIGAAGIGAVLGLYTAGRITDTTIAINYKEQETVEESK